MKEQILEFIQKPDYVSFQELSRAVDGSNGNFTLPLPDYENIIIWHSLSEQAGQALIELLSSKEIYIHRFSAQFAIGDGEEFPPLPIAKKLKDYNSPHWFPVTLSASAPK